MKYKLMVAFLIAATTVAAVVQTTNSFAQNERSEDSDFQERDETRQTYQLSPGARVEVSSISGSVDIETGNTDQAEVHIIRTARRRSDLEYRRIIVEHTPTNLSVRGEQDRDHRPPRGVEVRQRVILKLPRQVDLSTSSVSGSVRIGGVDGPVKVSSVSGSVTMSDAGGDVRVTSVSGSVRIGEVKGGVRASSISGSLDVEQAVGYLDVSSVSGSVSATIARLAERGLSIKSISGPVELRFSDDVNADLQADSISGGVHVDVPNVTLQGKLNSSNVRARIGAGGAPIIISSVSGNVRLTRGT
ncbi:MAG: DUF4097 family beta strand repeat protein [Pyrinomonadaceae bacterium]|nr:DUF4097 family beta strand repeat protein [Pyrinomonadaceae bacterium]